MEFLIIQRNLVSIILAQIIETNSMVINEKGSGQLSVDLCELHP